MAQHKRHILYLLFIFIIPFHVVSQELNLSSNNRFESLLKTSKEANLSTKERSYFALEALKIAEQQNNHQNKVKALYSLGIINLSTGNFGKSYSNLNEALQLLNTESITNFDPKEKAMLYNSAGIALKNISINHKALDFYQEALKIIDSIQWKKGKSMVYNNLFELYFIKKDFPKAYQFLSQAHKINQIEKDSTLLFDTTNNLILYHLNRNSDSVDIYIKQAIALSEKSNDNYNESFLLHNLGSFYVEYNDFAKARTYLNQSLLISRENNFQEIIAQSLYAYAKLFFKEQNYTQSFSYLNQGKAICKTLNMPYLNVNYLNLESELYAQQKNYSAAFNVLKSKNDLADSLQYSAQIAKSNQLEAFYNNEIHMFQKQLSLKQLEVTKGNDRFYLLLGITILCLGLLTLGYSIFIIQKNKQLKHKNEIISFQKEREMQLKLDYKNRQLTTLSIGKIHEKEYYNELVDGLNSIIFSKIPLQTKQKLISLRNKITNENSHDVWSSFKTLFEEIHPTFYDNLLAKHPNLTSNDLKLCAFIKLGFNTKEIASIAHKSIRTIESSRLKLRKNFNLPSNTRLGNYIKSNF